MEKNEGLNETEGWFTMIHSIHFLTTPHTPEEKINKFYPNTDTCLMFSFNFYNLQHCILILWDSDFAFFTRMDGKKSINNCG